MSDFQAEIISAIKSSNKIIIATHINPDSDAIASALGLYVLCQKFGKEVVFFINEVFPARVKAFINFEIKITSSDDFTGFDLLIATDCATYSRLSFNDKIETKSVIPLKIVNIDHHISNEKYGFINYVDATAAATALLAQELHEAAFGSIEPKIINLLFSGIADDTGGFRYNNTDQRVFQAIARLRASGANLELISQQLYFSNPLNVIKFYGDSINKLQLDFDNRFVSLTVDHETFKKFKINPKETDGIVDILRSIQGVQIIAFIREVDEKIKVSLRSSNSEINVNKLASFFGGGGHVAASGYVSKFSLEETRAVLLAKIKSDIFS